MPNYRAYKLSPAGRIVSGDWIEAPNDDEAKVMAQALCDAATPEVELWNGALRIATLACQHSAA